MSIRFALTDKMRDDFAKCMEKNIKSYPIPIENQSDYYYVAVSINGTEIISKDKVTKLPIKYEEQDAWKKIFEYYDYYAKPKSE